MDKEKILKKMKELNKHSYLPKYVFRRNSIHYELSTYMNHIIALFISDNVNPIPTFINRANKNIETLQQNQDLILDVDMLYIEKCNEILNVLENELKIS